jgi:diguanylate cyclase (GGDEF)-like protein
VQAKLEGLLKACPDLPSLPGVAVQLVREVQSGDIDLDRICSLLERDPALAAKVVSVANSSVYRRGAPVTTVRRAALALGANTVSTLALSFSLVRQKSGKRTFDFARFWRRVLFSAVASRVLARIVSVDPEEALLAGLLQDVGILALQAAVPEYDAILRDSRNDHLRLERLERERLGSSHPEVGAWLVQSWTLPDALAHAVLGSHVPLDDHRAAPLGRCVAASGYVAEIWLAPGSPAVTKSAAEQVSSWLSIDPAAFQAILAQVAADAESFAEPFDVALPSSKEMQATLKQARDALVQVSLRVGQIATKRESDAARLTEEKKALEQRVARDALTGVHTRGHLDGALVQAFSNVSRFDRPLSVLFCDIDHFKKVNDTNGHPFGDRVLAAVAREVAACARQLDVVGRYGGEEFVVVLPATDESGALAAAERIRGRVEALALSNDAGTRVPVSISIGVATHGARWKAENLPALLQAADSALYAAKRAGRNRVVAHSP